MRGRWRWMALALVAGAPPAAAQDLEHIVMAQLRLTTEPAVLRACSRIGPVSDDSLKDLRRKIVRVGGNAALLSFPVENLSVIHAEAFRCPPEAEAPPPPPPGAQPPRPGGAPPPPPPPR